MNYQPIFMKSIKDFVSLIIQIITLVISYKRTPNLIIHVKLLSYDYIYNIYNNYNNYNNYDNNYNNIYNNDNYKIILIIINIKIRILKIIILRITIKIRIIKILRDRNKHYNNQ